MSTHESSPIVATRHGLVRGALKNNDIGTPYLSFQGIPYAQQPVGNLRFRDPKPLDGWSEIFDATNEGDVPYTFSFLTKDGLKFVGGDNCLTLNVYTPDLNKKKPVFVWIYGGGFNTGSGSTELYGPDYLIEKDVVIVTFNYRLHIFGFLSFNDPEIGIPGNAGLKDQVMALRWVKENIQEFGGDPNNITLGGISAGSRSVHYHMISPMSKGLFHRAVLMSGTAYNPTTSIPAHYVLKFAEAIRPDDPPKDEKEAFEIISSADPVELTGRVFRFFPLADRILNGYFTPFLPVTEPFESESCFLPRPILELGRDAWSKDLDIIIGGVADEGLLFTEFLVPDTLEIFNSRDDAWLPLKIREHLSQDEANARGKKLKDTYVGDEKVYLNNTTPLIEYYADLEFWHGITRFIRQHLSLGGAGKVFFYRLATNHAADVGFCKVFRNAIAIKHLNGTGHAEDFPFLFKTVYDLRLTSDSATFNAANKFLELFINFIKHGSNMCQLPDLVWEAVQMHDKPIKCLNMTTGDKWKVIALPNWNRMELWDSVYNKQELI